MPEGGSTHKKKVVRKSVVDSNPTWVNILCDPQIVVLNLGIHCPFSPRDTGFIIVVRELFFLNREFLCFWNRLHFFKTLITKIA